jgi:hypothetical protein
MACSTAAASTEKDEQSSEIMGYNLEQCCPDGRVGFKASRGDIDPCVFYLKNGPPILIMVPEIASETF